MKKFDDKALMAYADFELSEEEHMEVELMLANDAEARAKVEDFRKTGAAISQFAALMDEEDPDRLFKTIHQNESTAHTDQITPSRVRPNLLNWAASLANGTYKRLLEIVGSAGSVLQDEPAYVFRGGVGQSLEISETPTVLDNLKLEIEMFLTEQFPERGELEQITETASIKLGDKGTIRIVTEFLSDTQFKGEKSTQCIEVEYTGQGMNNPILYVACHKTDGSWKIVSG